MGLLPVCGESLRAAELADRRASARRLAEARLVEIHVVQVQLQRLVVQLDQLPQCDPSRIRLGTDAMPHRVAQTKRGTTAERSGTRGTRSRATRFRALGGGGAVAGGHGDGGPRHRRRLRSGARRPTSPLHPCVPKTKCSVNVHSAPLPPRPKGRLSLTVPILDGAVRRGALTHACAIAGPPPDRRCRIAPSAGLSALPQPSQPVAAAGGGL